MFRRHLRRGLLGAAALLLVLTGAYFFLRDSSLFEVRDVTVQGTSGPDGPNVESTLTSAAREMTTLNVSADELKQAAHRFPTVESVEIDRDLPHRVTLTVHEKRPVAVVVEGDRRVPLAADGRLLEGATAPDDLPTLTVGDVTSNTVAGKKGGQLVKLVAAAPQALRRRADKALLDGETGLTLEMDQGPDLYFGNDDDLHAKWRAVARVLADPSSQGATYIDVRVPERAAAGGVAPPAEPDAEQPEQPVEPETPATGVPSPSTTG
jgi:cell division protein FtsQ